MWPQFWPFAGAAGSSMRAQAEKHKKLPWLRFCGKETDKRAAAVASCPPGSHASLLRLHFPASLAAGSGPKWKWEAVVKL